MMPGPVTLGKVSTDSTFQTRTRASTPMPIYDFKCRSCATQFEALVLKKSPKCPKCSGEDLERLLSMPALHTEGTHQRVMSNAKKAELKTAAEKNHAQRQYEQSHDD
jgi:putative FmdB family regulatory protein